MFLISDAYAQAAPAAQAGPESMLTSLGFMVLIFVVFYFLLIRPQQKRAKEHRALLEAIKKGDQVVTAGGLHGKVTAIDEAVVTLEVATGVNIKVDKGHIARVVTK